ncbi:coiled-coil domain-containing protein 60 isoform X2 [Engystomops pustulosus]|uniref:coiled-coil domain-containing protein 60 isoform X2 n=1 Tax=Engystomops pustulosus TaxID=76066 RepID=UPI003AFAE29D
MPGTDPRSYVLLTPLPVPSQKGLKVQARSPSHYTCWAQRPRDEVFREKYCRRQRQLSQQGYNAPNYKPYEELGHPLVLEARRLILHSLGQEQQDKKPEETDAKKEIPEEGRSETSSVSPLIKRAASSGSSVNLRYRRKDTSSFNKELNHTRKLIGSVKQGRGYFHILQQEEERKKMEAQAKQHLLHKKYRTEPQPFRDSMEDSSGDEEEVMKPDNKTRFFLTEIGEQQKKEKRAMSRPFTPAHNTLLSKQALDVDPDPGGCKTSLKRINREKDVEMKWEQFITPGKNKKQSQKFPRSHLRGRKMSFLSISRYSGLSSTLTPTIGSVSSLVPGSEDTAAGGTTSSDAAQEGGDESESTVNSSLQTPAKQSKEEDEEPLSEYMQTLLQMIAENVTKELDEENNWKNNIVSDDSLAQITETTIKKDQGNIKSSTQRPKSSPAPHLSPTNLFIKKKNNLSCEMRETFLDVADEADVYLHDKVEAMERRRQEFNTQKYRSLDTITNFRQDLEKMRKAYHHVKEEKDFTDKRNWFNILLSRIPSVLKNSQKIHTILEKLEKLEEKQFIRIRPHSFLKVLNALRTWELCSPDISVAIEFVREHLVQMPLEDYITWLQARLASSPSSRAQSAPPQR